MVKKQKSKESIRYSQNVCKVYSIEKTLVKNQNHPIWVQKHKGYFSLLILGPKRAPYLGPQGPGPGSRAPKFKSTPDPPTQVHDMNIYSNTNQ